MPIALKKTKHPYISINPNISGGQPVISGTRIKVMDIAIKYELMGIGVDRIIDEYPHLKPEQIHDALSYYYEHKNIFDRKYREERSIIEGLLRRKIEVISAKELGYLSKPDVFHIKKASELKAVILTHDVDFLKMANSSIEFL